jgi:hypothetical protein
MPRISTIFDVGPLGYFAHISIITPDVSALKTIISRAFYRIPGDYFKPRLDLGGGFKLKTPHDCFRSETVKIL